VSHTEDEAIDHAWLTASLAQALRTDEAYSWSSRPDTYSSERRYKTIRELADQKRIPRNYPRGPQTPGTSRPRTETHPGE